MKDLNAEEAWLIGEIQEINLRIEEVRQTAEESEVGDPEVIHRLRESVRNIDTAMEILYGYRDT